MSNEIFKLAFSYEMQKLLYQVDHFGSVNQMTDMPPSWSTTPLLDKTKTYIFSVRHSLTKVESALDSKFSEIIDDFILTQVC